MLKRTLHLALIATLLLAGCATPPEGSAPTPTPAPTPPPTEQQRPSPVALPEQPPSIPGAPAIEQHGEVLLVRGLWQSALWYAGGRRIAVTNDSGLWSLSPSGEPVELLAPAGSERSLIGPHADGLVYVERQPGALVAYFARPGQEPMQVGTVQGEGLGQPGYPFWGTMAGSRLILAIEGMRARALDLETGKTAELGDEAIPVQWGELALSPNHRHLAYTTYNRADEVRILDLATGMVFRPTDEAHLPGVTWDSAGTRWAVRAAEPDSGLPVAVGANMVEGATHLDLGDVKGALQHLTPPHPLTLVEGPWWSADGQYLAVVAGDITRLEAPRTLWLVDLTESRWRSHGRLPQGAVVGGFVPQEPAVAVRTPTGLLLWPASGDDPQAVDQPWLIGANSPTLLASGSLLYLSDEPEPRIIYQRPGGEAVDLVTEPGPKGPLLVGSNYGAVTIYRDGPVHDLLLFPLPR